MGNTNQSALFESVPPQDYFQFLNNGEVKAEKVVKFLKYKKQDVAVATGISLGTVRYDSKMPAELRQRLIEWATAINLVGSYFKDHSKTILWFDIPNHLLGGVAPRDMIRMGRFNKLLKFIQAALSENQR